jgi:hypothetical protein
MVLRSTREFLYDNFHLDKFVDKKRLHDNIAALKKEGYIDLVNTKTAGPDRFEIIVLEKGKKLFVREEKGKLYFNVADVEIKILSITERPGKNGDLACKVVYTEKLTRNRFMELWGVTHCFDGSEYTSNATLVHTKDGWDVVLEDYN